ncbi:PilZ domain-containing protein [Bradyrhizobium lablabi]|nr:PilZ domain-containing protein [Bradyrhizobium lablabi]
MGISYCSAQKRLRKAVESGATTRQAVLVLLSAADCCSARAPLFNVLPIASSLERHPGPNGMEEKRKHPRTDTEEPAFVSSGGSVMRCVVRNVSLEGAAIDVENPAFVPQRFRLVMANDSSIVHECQVAWIQKNRIGLTFIDLK